jgi:hypothetical protein
MRWSRVQASSRLVSSSARGTLSSTALPIRLTTANDTRAGRCPPPQGARAGQDRRHQRRPAAGGELDLQVVDLAGEPPVAVDQLPVEQVQPGLQDAAGHGGQLPALVRTISGIVTTATTSSRSR